MPKQEKDNCLHKDGCWVDQYIKEKNEEKVEDGYVYEMTYEETKRRLDSATVSHFIMSSGDQLVFDIISEDWLNAQKPGLKVSSYSKYSNLLHSYLLPAFGEYHIESISRSEVLQFSRDLLTTGGVKKTGLSPKTVNSVLSILKNILKYADRERGFHVASIEGISIRQQQKPMRILSRNEQAILSKHLYSNLTPCHLGILLCLYTGMRIGEVCALKWEDIILEEQCLYVHQSMQRVQNKEEKDSKTKVIIQTPKSDCSIRKIPVPNEMLQLLVLSKKQNEAFLLTGLVNSYIEPRCLENHLDAVTKACGISKINFHALRHTFATRCVELGFDIKSLSEILGHASVDITLNRYVHPSMELKQKNMNRLSALITSK